MEKRLQITVKNRLVTSLLTLACALFMFAPGAEAHYFSVLPKVSRTEVGSRHSVIVSFTHISTQAQYDYSFMGLTPDREMLSGKLIYSDGTEKDITDMFAAYDDPEGTEVKGTDSRLAAPVITKEGTVTAACRTRMDIPGMMSYTGFSKHIFNTAFDRLSMKPAGGDDVTEIVPLSDLAGAAAGVPVRFRLLHKGEARAGAEIEYASDRSPIFIGEEGPENLKKLERPTDEDGIFSYTPDAAGRHTVAAMLDLGDKNYSSATLSFEVREKSGGSGGCSAAHGGILSLFAAGALFLLPVIKSILKKRSER